jgi:hypothetical protein
VIYYGGPWRLSSPLTLRSNINISFPFQNPIIMSYINADKRCREKIFQISQEKNLSCRLCKERMQFETPEDVAYTNADSIGRQVVYIPCAWCQGNTRKDCDITMCCRCVRLNKKKRKFVCGCPPYDTEGVITGIASEPSQQASGLESSHTKQSSGDGNNDGGYLSDGNDNFFMGGGDHFNGNAVDGGDPNPMTTMIRWAQTKMLQILQIATMLLTTQCLILTNFY